MKKTILIFLIATSVFAGGFFLGRYDLQEKLKFARMQTTRNMLLINDHQCEEKLRSILEDIQKPKTKGWF